MKNDLELNSLAVELRRDWEIDPYSPLNILSLVLSKIPDLTILFYPMSQETSGMCIKEDKMKIIGINSIMTKGRQRFTLAHELYHLLFENECNKIFICKNQSKDYSEREADSFASFFLMTDEGFKRYGKINNIKDWDLDAIISAEQYFQISHKGFLVRLNKANIEPKEDYKNKTISFEAKKRGFSDELYLPPKYDSPIVFGNYIKMINVVDELVGLTEGKKRELLLDGYRGDLVFNIKELKRKNE